MTQKSASENRQTHYDSRKTGQFHLVLQLQWLVLVAIFAFSTMYIVLAAMWRMRTALDDEMKTLGIAICSESLNVAFKTGLYGAPLFILAKAYHDRRYNRTAVVVFILMLFIFVLIFNASVGAQLPFLWNVSKLMQLNGVGRFDAFIFIYIFCVGVITLSPLAFVKSSVAASLICATAIVVWCYAMGHFVMFEADLFRYYIPISGGVVCATALAFAFDYCCHRKSIVVESAEREG